MDTKILKEVARYHKVHAIGAAQEIEERYASAIEVAIEENEKLRAEVHVVGERRDWYAGDATDAKGALATANADIYALRAENAELKARLERTEKSGTGQPDFSKVGG